MKRRQVLKCALQSWGHGRAYRAVTSRRMLETLARRRKTLLAFLWRTQVQVQGGRKVH